MTALPVILVMGGAVLLGIVGLLWMRRQGYADGRAVVLGAVGFALLAAVVLSRVNP